MTDLGAETVIGGRHTLLGYLHEHGVDSGADVDDDNCGWFGWAVEGDLLTATWRPAEDGEPGQPVSRSWRLVPAEAVSPTTTELAAKAHGAWDATFGCPVQVIFGPDDITDCTFRRGHGGSHSWAAPADEAVTGK